MKRAGVTFLFSVFFLFTGMLFAETDPLFEISHTAGRYSKDIIVKLTPKKETVILYYSFGYASEDGETSYTTEYTLPLYLSALPGKKREYTVNVKAIDEGRGATITEYKYIIDKSFPAPPSISPAPGVYKGECEINFSADRGTSVIYSINEPVFKGGEAWIEEPIKLQSDEQGPRLFTVYAYTVDGFGKKSRVYSWNFTIKARRTAGESRELTVLSPVHGTFANPQFLYIEQRDFEWIRYTVNGDDPAQSGAVYEQPELIDFTGTINLKIAAKPRDEEVIVRKEVEYSVAPKSRIAAEPDVSPKSGIYSSRMNFTVDSNGTDPVHYTFTEQSVDIYDPVYTEAVTLRPLTGGVTYYPVRLATERMLERGLPEYRFFVVFDDRKPAPPVIQLHDEMPLRRDTKVTIDSSDINTIYYTTDGTSPDRSSQKYSGTFPLKLPENVGSGSLTVRARAYAPNGKGGAQVTELVTFDKSSPSPPRIIGPLEYDSGEKVDLELESDEQSSILFERSFGDDPVSDPDKSSAECEERLTISVPYGMERTINFRFAAKDKAGNVSAPTEKATVHIDRAPPPAPNILFDSGIVRLIGEGSIYYSLSEINSLPDIPDIADNLYSSPLVFSGRENERSVYYVSAVAVDEYGNASSITGPRSFVVDKRKPVMPVLRGIKNGERLNSDDALLRIENRTAGLSVLYTVTKDGSEPPDPDFSSARAENNLRFEGESGKEVKYRVKLIPAFVEQKRLGPVEEISFVIDRKAPNMPIVEGVEEGKRYNHDITVTLSSIHENEAVYYVVSNNPDQLPSPFSDQGYVFPGSLEFDTAKNREETFYLRFGSEDRAGNRTISDTVYRFTIDRKPPEPPAVSGIPQNGIGNEPVTVVLQSEGNSIFYRLLKNRIAHTAEGSALKRYEGPISATGEEGEEITYYLNAVTEDRSGNRSLRPLVKKFTVDRKMPKPPPDPLFSRSGSDPNSVIVSWPTLSDDEIFYRIRSESKFGTSRFRKYTKPIEPELLSEELVIDYYREDWAGNRTRIYSRSETFPRITSGPYIRGVEDQELYGEELTVRNRTEKGLVRFEVIRHPDAAENSPRTTRSQNNTPRVTRFSPVFPASYTFPAVNGEEVTYTLALKLYRDEHDHVGNSARGYTFTIDKKQPKPPTVSGVEEGEFYRKSRTITLQSDEGTVFYSLKKTDDTDELPSHEDFRQYTRPIAVEAEPGSFQTYSLSAYTVDKAGNKSKRLDAVSFFIDREIIYVSKTEGNDYFDGTRTRPYRSVRKALEEARISGRRTIVLGASRYEINAPLVISDSITLKGGYEPSSWKKAYNRETMIEPGKYFPNDADLITCEGGRLHLDSIMLGDTLGSSDVLLRVNAGRVYLKSFNTTVSEHYEGIPILQNGGFLTIDDCTMFSERVSFPYLIGTNGGELTVQNSTFRIGSDKKDFAIVAVKAGRAVFKKSFLTGGTGENIVNCRISDAEAIFDEVTLETGKSGTTSVGIFASNANVDIHNSIITGNADSRTTVGVQGKNSRIAISDSTITLDADRGANALYAKESQLKIVDSTILSKKTEEYGYLVRCIDTEGEFFNNHFIMENSFDILGFEFIAGENKFFNNTCIFPSMENSLYGFKFKESPKSDLINNIIIAGHNKTGDNPHGIAIISQHCGNQMITANNFYGWGIVLELDGKEVSTSEELNMADTRPFRGRFQKNISESYSDTFISKRDLEFLLREDSLCVDGGYDVEPSDGPTVDRQGEARPNPDHGIRPAYDIGSDEFYE